MKKADDKVTDIAVNTDDGAVGVTGKLEYSRRRRRFGDRKDGRRLRTLDPLIAMTPYIMPRRSDALNTFCDKLEISAADRICRKKVLEGKTNFSMLHMLLAAYVRTISQRPAVNRFVSGQRIYARNEIVFIMTVKKEMSLRSPETVVKVKFAPSDTLNDVYEKFNATISEAVASLDTQTAFDSVAKTLSKVPNLFLRAAMRFLGFLDYHGWMPRALTDVSPFHGSMIITSMGSLGINPIYHHIYDFGNLPVFLSYGMRKTSYEYDRSGELVCRRYMEIKAVTDERICDGYYYASAFKYFRRLIEHPEMLECAPEKLIEDID